MRKRGFVTAFLMMIFVLFNTISVQGKDTKLFEEIINLADGSIEEVGVRLSFNTEEHSKDMIDQIYKTLELRDIDTVEMSKDHGHDNLIFSGKEIRGTIENIEDSSGSTVIINITKKTQNNNLKELKNIISNSLGQSASNIKLFYSIKAKLPSNDISETNNKILSYLKDSGSTSLDTIDISNGYSTVAYTRLFEPIDVSDTPIDFNYAVVTYSTGSYIILGTPIIMTPY